MLLQHWFVFRLSWILCLSYCSLSQSIQLWYLFIAPEKNQQYLSWLFSVLTIIDFIICRFVLIFSIFYFLMFYEIIHSHFYFKPVIRFCFQFSLLNWLHSILDFILFLLLLLRYQNYFIHLFGINCIFINDSYCIFQALRQVP